MICNGCGSSDSVERWMLDLYQMNLCPTCGESNPMFGAMDGTRPVRFSDIEARRFSEGIADLVKTLYGGRQ